MNYKLKTKFGLTLMEMTVVIVTIVLLVGLGLPAVRALLNSFESQSGGESIISAALASAHAIAAREQKYSGLRFQNSYHGNNKGSQYMVFIIQDPNLDDSLTISRPFKVAYGFRALKGLKPIKLPEMVGIMEFVRDITEIDNDDKVKDKTAFSVLFSPTGKLIIHDVQVLRKNPDDKIFNEINSDAMFTDDYYNGPAFHREPSKNSFVIYDKTQFDKLGPAERLNYLRGLKVVYINPYTGTIINQ